LYRRHQGLLAQALRRHHQSTPVQRRAAVKSKGGAECSELGQGTEALKRIKEGRPSLPGVVSKMTMVGSDFRICSPEVKRATSY